MFNLFLCLLSVSYVPDPDKDVSFMQVGFFFSLSVFFTAVALELKTAVGIVLLFSKSVLVDLGL